MKDGKENLILKLKVYNLILDDLGYSPEVCESIIDTIENLKIRSLEKNNDFLYGIGELDKCIKKISRDGSKRLLYKMAFNFLPYYIDHICFLQQGMNTDDFKVSHSKSDSKYIILNSKGIYATLMKRQIDTCRYLMNLILVKYPEFIKKELAIESTEVLSLELIDSINIVALIDNYIKLINYKIDVMHDILYKVELSEEEIENFKLKLDEVNILISQIYKCISQNILKDESILEKVIVYFKRK